MKRRRFCKALLTGLAVLPACKVSEEKPTTPPDPGPQQPKPESSKVFWIKNIPDQPFSSPNLHRGIGTLMDLMQRNGYPFYRFSMGGLYAHEVGLIASDDVVLIKVNAQWKYRGCTNSDLVRGLVQGILDHPEGFRGEVVIIENGQGRGSLNCDTPAAYGGDTGIHANANDESHTFLYLANEVFKGQPVSAYLLDPIRSTFIGSQDHATDGYRKLENISYPCFTSARGTRIELKEGIWNGSEYGQNLKLINVPVLKHHDVGGAEITGALKHFYGVLSMSDGNIGSRHYEHLGEACGNMITMVRPPVLNIIDAIWVSHGALTGYPASTTFRANQILASQDPVALDYWAAKNVIYPIDSNPRHHPDFPGINSWLDEAAKTINDKGGIFKPEWGIRIGSVTKTESEIQVFSADVS